MPVRTPAEAKPRTTRDLNRVIRLTVRKINDGADRQATIDDAFRKLYGPQRDLLAGLYWQALIEQQTADTR